MSSGTDDTWFDRYIRWTPEVYGVDALLNVKDPTSMGWLDVSAKIWNQTKP